MAIIMLANHFSSYSSVIGQRVVPQMKDLKNSEVSSLWRSIRKHLPSYLRELFAESVHLWALPGEYFAERPALMNTFGENCFLCYCSCTL